MKKADVQKGRRGKKGDKQRDVLLCILAISFLLGTVLGTTVENSMATEPYILRFFQDCTMDHPSLAGRGPGFKHPAVLLADYPDAVFLSEFFLGL